jgi:cell division protein FtsI/penicillin-binding protein 2
LILIAVRVWHLSVVQHEKRIEESKRPQRRTVLERSERATIYDRFGIPLATNKVQYNAAIEYAPIRNIPRMIWAKDEHGKRTKVLKRTEYIAELSHKLGEELHLDPVWLDDLIHSKAAILGNVPCVIKENITEEQYFRLKMLAKDWPGIYAEVAPKRCYPLGPSCGEVVGYIGPISRREYDAITREMGGLREALAALEEGEELAGLGGMQDLKERLEELEKKAYRINDSVGKMGVEAAYDEDLRGLCGKHIYLSDIRGNYLMELPGSTGPVAGCRLVLTLSSELQTFAQELLEQSDAEDSASLKQREFMPENQPWIKGGAIVALNAKTGEVYALASYPALDPNDFIRPENDPETVQKNRRVNQWLETDSYLGSIWDMKCLYTKGKTDGLEMGWKTYLGFVLPKDSPVRDIIERRSTVVDAVALQKKVDQLISLFQCGDKPLAAGQIFDFIYNSAEDKSAKMVLTLQDRDFLRKREGEVKDAVAKLKEELKPYFSGLSLNYDKMLLADLYRLAVDATRFHPHLNDLAGKMTLHEYRDACARFSSIVAAIRKLAQEIYFENDFKMWISNI